MEPYERFERDFARYLDCSEFVTCSSGTSALHLALLALGVGPGDEVIVPNFTMAAVPFAVTYTGAKPVFVDCAHDLNIDPRLIKITPKTRAIIAVHTYGRPCDMDALLAFGVPVIEDCAEAHGATIDGRKLGTLGTLGCFSFYKNKILHAEEGGGVSTNDPKLAERVRHLKNLAFDKEHTYYHDEIAYNYRMPNSTAQTLLHGLPSIDSEIRRRKEMAESIVGYKELPRKDGSVYWVKDVLFSTTEERDAFVKSYGASRRFFRPMTTLPMWKTEECGLAHLYSELGAYFIL